MRFFQDWRRTIDLTVACVAGVCVAEGNYLLAVFLMIVANAPWPKADNV